MKYDLNGKVAIVVGGSGSIGSAVCRLLAESGAKVAAAARTQAALDTVVNDLRADGYAAMAVAADVTCSESMDAMADAVVRAYGRVDILVNCAGVRGRLDHRNPLQDYDDDLWERVIRTEMTGVFYAMKPVLRQMLRQGQGGSIVNVGSASGITPLKHQCAYTAAKAGMFNFTRAAALEYGPDRIRINGVAPGEVFNDALRALMDAEPESAEAVVSHTPAGRLAKPEDIAGLICFLATDAASYITGSVIAVDGAWTVGYTRDF